MPIARVTPLFFGCFNRSSVGVAVVGLTNNVPVRLSSPSEELAVSH